MGVGGYKANNSSTGEKLLEEQFRFSYRTQARYLARGSLQILFISFSRRFSYTSCYLLYISSLYQRPTITFIYRSHRREVILNYRRHKFIVGNILQLLLSKTTLNISILLYIKKQKKKNKLSFKSLETFLGNFFWN